MILSFRIQLALREAWLNQKELVFPLLFREDWPDSGTGFPHLILEPPAGPADSRPGLPPLGRAEPSLKWDVRMTDVGTGPLLGSVITVLVLWTPVEARLTDNSFVSLVFQQSPSVP